MVFETIASACSAIRAGAASVARGVADAARRRVDISMETVSGGSGVQRPSLKDGRWRTAVSLFAAGLDTARLLAGGYATVADRADA